MIPKLKLIPAAGLAFALASMPALGQTPDLNQGQEIAIIKKQMDAMRSLYEQQIQALETRIQTLEKQKTVEKSPSQPAVLAARPQGLGREFQIGLSVSTAAGGSSENNEVLSNLQRGEHDPNKNGFTLQSGELFLGGSVSPDFDAQANIIFKIDAEGETLVELEEMFFVTRTLPYGFQVKGGQYFTEFGRANAMHLHQWDFVDQPVILSRLFGPDGLRSQGVRVSWLPRLPWYSEFFLGAQNAKGETAVSFLGNAGEEIAGFTLGDRQSRNLSDLLYAARWLNGFDVSDRLSVNLGFSGLYGPNATGSDTKTYVVGGDLYAKWQPESTQRGFPFVSFQAEALYRNYVAGDPARTRLDDWGAFGQVIYGFSPGLASGLRLDFAGSDGNDPTDPFRDTRWRLSPNLTWFPTEFTKVRLQYNRDWAQFLPNDSADTIWLQFQFSLGSHFAHTF